MDRRLSAFWLAPIRRTTLATLLVLRDVTAAMLVVKNKSISLLWELNVSWQFRKTRNIRRFIWIQTYRIFDFSRRLFAKHHTLSSLCRIFSSMSKSREIWIKSIFMVISIILKTAFWQILIYSQSLMKILWRSEKDKLNFKAIEKHRYTDYSKLNQQFLVTYSFLVILTKSN